MTHSGSTSGEVTYLPRQFQEKKGLSGREVADAAIKAVEEKGVKARFLRNDIHDRIYIEYTEEHPQVRMHQAFVSQSSSHVIAHDHYHVAHLKHDERSGRWYIEVLPAAHKRDSHKPDTRSKAAQLADAIKEAARDKKIDARFFMPLEEDRLNFYHHNQKDLDQQMQKLFQDHQDHPFRNEFCEAHLEEEVLNESTQHEHTRLYVKIKLLPRASQSTSHSHPIY